MAFSLALTTAILGDMARLELFRFLSSIGVYGAEVMCWPNNPRMKDTRKFAGTVHLDVNDPDDIKRFADDVAETGVQPVALGYYPNPLDPDLAASKKFRAHMRDCILACEKTDVRLFDTFIGKDYTKTSRDNRRRFLQVWREMLKFAADHGVTIGIENCPMRFGYDEWPGGKNLACTPAFWNMMFQELGTENLGLVFDPSHLILQGIDVLRAVEEFACLFVLIHAKDLELSAEGLYQFGIFADRPKDIHEPKIPGRGQVPWTGMFTALTKAGYNGSVSIEVEEVEFDPGSTTVEKRQESVLLSRDFLERVMTGVDSAFAQPDDVAEAPEVIVAAALEAAAEEAAGVAETEPVAVEQG